MYNTADSHTGKYTAPPYLHLALGHRWPWDQVGGARVGRGTVALRCLGCLPTITSSISGVKDAQRSRRQSIWAVYTSLRHTAKYTGFGCISYVYSPLASSRLACQDIQRIQRIQPYSHTRHTSYSAIQPPSVPNKYRRNISGFVHYPGPLISGFLARPTLEHLTPRPRDFSTSYPWARDT